MSDDTPTPDIVIGGWRIRRNPDPYTESWAPWVWQPAKTKHPDRWSANRSDLPLAAIFEALEATDE